MNKRTLIRLAFANPASAVYLTVVAGAMAVATGVSLFGQDPGFIWVWPALFTAPSSFATLPAGMLLWGESKPPLWFSVGALVAAALVQSMALGALWAALRRGRRPLPGPRNG
ncbi:SCO4225 family membrane protein [Streptomyces sp. NPDC090077]|uniref:SCO4225 family membrane protein n=1 Tax=Streptomyces sp. NPDC090077 TaxID=3365938 RepID=UPI00381E33A1